MNILDLLLVGLPMVLAWGIGLWGLIDCARTPDERIRFVPKWVWLLFLLCSWTLGALVWVYVGKRSIRSMTRRTAKGPTQRVEPFTQAR